MSACTEKKTKFVGDGLIRIKKTDKNITFGNEYILL